MLKLNKEKFLETEMGRELKYCITRWDKVLGICSRYQWGTPEHRKARAAADKCQVQWEVYQMALRQFYGVEYCFTRTDEYFGVVTQDEEDWLLKVERISSGDKAPGIKDFGHATSTTCSA